MAMLDSGLERARERVGVLAVDGRVRRLPDKFEDDYTLESKTLGDGFSGPVVAARCNITGAPCAVKTFQMSGWSEDRRRHAVNEVIVSLCMDHPHIVRVSAVYVTQETIRIVMERLEGGELFSRLMEDFSFSERGAAQASRQMLLALNYIHTQGISHRDIKLENFLYSEEGGSWLKLIDFGFAAFTSGERMTERLGTVRYVAPEVLEQDYSGGTCDIWSLGVVVYALLCGSLPFDHPSKHAMAEAILAGAYTTTGGPWSGISSQGRSFVRGLLARDPQRRLTAEQALNHPFLVERCPRAAAGPRLESYVCRALGCFAQASAEKQACLQIVALSLGPDERFELEVAFAEFDKSNTGMIDPRELSRLTQDDEEAAALLRRLEESGRPICCSDFVAALVSLRPRHYESSIRSAFRRFDLGLRGDSDAPSTPRDASSGAAGGCEVAGGDLVDMSEDDLVKFLCSGCEGQEEIKGPPTLGPRRLARAPSLGKKPWRALALPNMPDLAMLASVVFYMCGPSVLPAVGL